MPGRYPTQTAVGAEIGTAEYPKAPLGPGLSPSRQAARWARRPLDFLLEARERHGDVFTLHAEGEPWVVVGDPGLIEQVLTAPAGVLHAGEGNRGMAPLLGPTTLPLLDGERHIHRRRLLMPPFRGAKLKRYEETIGEVAAAQIDRWPTQTEVPIWPRLQKLMLEAILHIVLADSAEESLAALRDALRDLGLPAAPGQRVRLSNFESVLAPAHRAIATEIDRRRSEPEGQQGEDILALLLGARHEDGSPLSEDEVCSELMMLLITGHETTATALAWALDLLSREPAALERVAVEAGSGGGPFTEAAIREALRLRPPVPLIARRTKRPFSLGEHLIPAEVTITPCPLLVHHRADVYPDPFAFRPERFLDQAPGTYTWLPFGGGVRRCIGAHFAQLEMRVVLSTMLRRVAVRASRPQPEEMRSRAATLTPARGVRVILEKS
jgi:cytochrome P450 family 135